MPQAARVPDTTAKMMLAEAEPRAGSVIEVNDTSTIYTRPRDKRSEDFVTGRFG
jgi:phosphate transport system ATP-binding protein